MTAAHICICCAHCKTEIVEPRGSEQKQLVVMCEEAHAPIWLFSGAMCEDYQPKPINQTQEQK